MAKTTAPLLGFGAAGQIGKTQVYAQWKGRGYARRYLVPANPNTTAQQETRNAFAWLMGLWKVAAAAFQAPWTAYAKGLVLTNRNAVAKFNVSNLRTADDLSDFVFSPGAGGGIAPTSIAATAGDGTLTIAFTNPTAPTDWTLAGATACAIKNAFALPDTDYTSVTGVAATPFTSVSLEGLTNDTEYQVGGWLTWTKPDGSTAYSTSVNTTGTPSA